MKTHFLSFTVLFGLIAGVFAEEATKPSVSITAKRQTLDASHDRGVHSESSDKEVTLRVEIRNVTNETLEGAELTGEVIINRSKNEKERMVVEELKSIKLPAMKPNERLTVDLGKIILNKARWKNRTFEETLEQWKVVCKKGEANIGENLSDKNYDGLVKEMEKEHDADREHHKQKIIRGRDKENILRDLRK
ncbi:MAG: hypothetical protein ACK46A_08190 [Akkermansiaceae bacterium]|jgi:hypothetical protein|nr:hypothetical protein [Luteolibacter sp.]